MIIDSEIDLAISAREAEINRLRHDLEIAEAELRGMKIVRDRISSLPVARRDSRPRNDEAGSPKAVGGDNPHYRGGRQPGAISKLSRGILEDLHRSYHSGFGDHQYVLVASHHGLEMRPKDARNRIDAYKEHGYIENMEPGRYIVTDAAAIKFGFFGNKLDANEAPTSELEGAS
jgi:hypothetical protein